MAEWLRTADTKRAEPCLRWLLGHLRTGVFDGSRPLIEAIERDSEGFLRLLRDRPPMCKAIERTAGTMRTAIEREHDPDDVRLVQCVASMLDVFMLCADEAKAPQTLVDTLCTSHEAALRQSLALAHAQVEGLCRFITNVSSFLGQLALGSGRFILIEMPSGNSVAIKMLAVLLRQHARVDIVPSLSRKSVKPVGITPQAVAR